MLSKPVYVVDGARTPFLKATNRPGPFSAGDLATQAGKTLLVLDTASAEAERLFAACVS